MFVIGVLTPKNMGLGVFEEGARPLEHVLES
jgi:hypothetical protein